MRHPAFERLWPGLSISYLGDQFTIVALLWFGLQLTGSGAAVGLVILCFDLPGVVTRAGARANQDTPDLLPHDKPSVEPVIKALKSYWGNEISDPAKVAQLILRRASSDQLPAHLLRGSDAVQYAAQAQATRDADANAGERLASRQTSTLPCPCRRCASEE